MMKTQGEEIIEKMMIMKRNYTKPLCYLVELTEKDDCLLTISSNKDIAEGNNPEEENNWGDAKRATLSEEMYFNDEISDW